MFIEDMVTKVWVELRTSQKNQWSFQHLEILGTVIVFRTEEQQGRSSKNKYSKLLFLIPSHLLLLSSVDQLQLEARGQGAQMGHYDVSASQGTDR